jgi:hypothetical protein
MGGALPFFFVTIVINDGGKGGGERATIHPNDK